MPGINIELTVRDKGSAAVRRVDKDLRGLDKTTRTVDKTFSQVSGTFTKFAGVLGVGLGIEAVRRGFVDTINVQREYGTALSDLSAISGATGKQLDFLSDQSREFGRTTTLSATESVVAFKLIASAKPDLLESSEALAAVTREAITLAEAATIDMPLAAKTLGASLNQFDLAASQSNRVINVLAAGAKFGASEISQTALALKESGTVAASANISFEETNAAIQALASVSIVGSQAGTNLRNVILKLQNEGIDELDPAVVGLTQSLKNLGEQGLSNTELSKIFGLESVTAAKVLIDQADAVESLTEKLTGTATATEQADTKTKTLDGDIDKLSNSYTDLQLTVSKTSEESLRGFIQTTTETINVVNNLIKTIAVLNDADSTPVNAIDVRIEGLRLQQKFLEETLASAAQGDFTFIDRVFLGPERALKIQLDATKSKLEILAAERKGLLSLEDSTAQPDGTEKTRATLATLKAAAATDAAAEKALRLKEENEKTAMAAERASLALISESTALAALQARVAPAIESLSQLQAQQQSLAETEKTLLAQRAAIREGGDVKLRNLFGDGALDFSGLGVDEQFLSIQERVAALRDEIATTTGATQQAAISDLENIVPKFKQVSEELFNPAFARSQTEELMNAIVAAQQAGLDAQLSQIEEQRSQTETSIALIRDFASGVGDDISALFANVQTQAANTTEKAKADFVSLLQTITQATQAVDAVSFQARPGPFGPSSTTNLGTSGINDPLRLGSQGSLSPIVTDSFAVGTPFVPRDMVAQIHEGEAVIPAHQNPFNASASRPIGGTTIDVGGITVIAKSDDPVQLAKQLKRELNKLAAFGV